jgi:hypothetical protein
MSPRRRIPPVVCASLAAALAGALTVACNRPLAPQPVPGTGSAVPPLASAEAPVTLDTLLADYRALGLPMPPADARLVRYETAFRSVLANDVERQIVFLGFELPREVAGERPLLIGTERIQQREREEQVVAAEPTAQAAVDVNAELYAKSPFSVNAALATALQAKARGWDALAGALLELATKTSAGHSYSHFFQPAGTPPRQALAMLARAHFANELTEPTSDWRSIATRFEASLAIGAPARKTDFGPFLRSLHATLDAPRAPAGSIEAKIDALCEMGGETRQFRRLDETSAFTQLVELGFDAVPALIEHIEDERLTRTVRLVFNNQPTYHVRLAELVSDLLQGFAGDDLGKDWLRRRQGYPVERAAAVAWWNKAKARGERATLVASVLPAGDAYAPNWIALHALAHKDPTQLEVVYRAALGRSKVITQEIAEAIATSPLPAAERTRILLSTRDRATVGERLAALRALQPVDPAKYARELVRELDLLPATPTEAYWKAPESAASRLASETADPAVWAALLRATRRADVGLRLELLGTMTSTYLADRQKRERLAYLASFLDDAAVPDRSKNPTMWEGPRIGFNFPPLSVRDVAAMTIASISRCR